jgi:hypothetical protein
MTPPPCACGLEDDDGRDENPETEAFFARSIRMYPQNKIRFIDIEQFISQLAITRGTALVT